MAKVSYKYVISSNILGNMFEWYDYTLFGTLAVIIAPIFFPHKNAVTSLLLTFTAFALGFITRPLGGVVYGYFGDRYGRRKSLLASIIFMAIPSALLGLLPSYHSIGIVSSLLVVILRLLQGMASGGEFIGSSIFLMETGPQHRRGLFGSFAMIGVLMGILLGTMIVSIFSAILSKAAFAAWGWRIPFLFGSLIGLIVWVLRSRISEPELFKKAQKVMKAGFSLFGEAYRYKKAIIKGFIIFVFSSVAFYLLLVYTTTYFNQIIGMSLAKSTLINSYMIVITLIFTPLAALLSDYIGRKKVLIFALAAFIILAYPINVYLLKHATTAFIYSEHTLLCILFAMYLGAEFPLIAELMPTRIRYLGCGIATNTAVLISGITPLTNTWLIEKIHILHAPAYLLILSAAISLLGVLSVPETYRAKI